MTGRSLWAAICAAALCLALAACGGDDRSGASERPPSASALMTEALRAADRQRSAFIAFAADVRGNSPDPEVRQFLGEPISVRLSGGVSERAISVAGAVGALGRREQLAVSADAARTFIGYGGTRYGPTTGLGAAGGDDDRGELRRVLEVVRRHGNRFISGRVTAGPDVDGPTWQVSGPLDASGIVRALQAEGERISAEDQKVLRVLAPLVRVTVAAGREDRLPRRIAVRLTLTREQAARIRTFLEEGDELPVDELDVSLRLDMTRWGQPVEPAAVRDPQPLEALSGALGGALLGAGG